MNQAIGVVAIAIGVAMNVQWTTALARRRVPEFATRPAEIRLHLVAEFATAAVLVVGGATLLADSPVGAPLALFGFGMLTYTALVSPGYFLDRGERGPIAMFAVIVIAALMSATLLIADLAT